MSNENFLKYLKYYKEYLEKYKLTCHVLGAGFHYVNSDISLIRKYRDRDDIDEIGVVCLYSFFI